MTRLLSNAAGRDSHDHGGSDMLVVYGASDCSLCDRALDVLRDLLPSLGLTLRYVRIDGQPELERKYREQIPVGFLGGRKLFKYHVDEQRLRRAVERRGQWRRLSS